MRLQIFPTEDMIVFGRTEVVDPGLKALLLPEWHDVPRLLIQVDGTIFVGTDPAVRFDGPGLGLIDEICKLPAVQKSLDDLKARGAERAQAHHDAAVAHVKAQVHPMQVVAKADTQTYWTPTMPGYEAVSCDPSAGDRLFSRGLDAETAGFAPGVAPPVPDAPKKKRKGK